TGVAITAGTVNLAGLLIDGSGLGAHGIRFTSGNSLTIDNCIVRNLTNNGVEFSPSSSSSLAISETFIGDNGSNGVAIFPTGSVDVVASIDRVEVRNSNTGFNVSGNTSTGTVAAVALNSVAHRNTSDGFIVQSASGHAATDLMLIGSVASFNGNIGVLST